MSVFTQIMSIRPTPKCEHWWHYTYSKQKLPHCHLSARTFVGKYLIVRTSHTLCSATSSQLLWTDTMDMVVTDTVAMDTAAVATLKWSSPSFPWEQELWSENTCQHMLLKSSCASDSRWRWPSGRNHRWRHLQVRVRWGTKHCQGNGLVGATWCRLLWK